MGLLQSLGKILGGVGKATNFLPNKILDAFHLPHMTAPLEMIGGVLEKGSKYQFGRDFGNNAKLGAGAAAVFFGGPALLKAASSAFGAGGGGAGVGAGATTGTAPTASSGKMIMDAFLNSAAQTAGSNVASSAFGGQSPPPSELDLSAVFDAYFKKRKTQRQSFGVDMMPARPAQTDLADNPVIRAFLNGPT